MSASKNLCIFIGNLGKDPEIRYAPSGDCIANFSIACTDKWKDKASGEWKESTEWIRCTAFGRLAEIVRDYVTQGMSVYVEGKFRTRSYEKDGQTRYATEIRLDSLQMLGGGRKGEGEGEQRANRSQQSERPQPGQKERQGQKAGSANHGGGAPDFDDDIPFRQPYIGMQLLSCM